MTVTGLMVMFVGLGLMMACMFVAIERGIKMLKEIRETLRSIQQGKKGE